MTATRLRIDGQWYADFELALEYLEPLEGGYSNRADDRGGATSGGISLRFLKLLANSDLNRDGFGDGDLNRDGNVDIRDIQSASRAQRAYLYETYFWQHYKLFNIKSQHVANRVFSIYVHMEPADAGAVVQRACRANLQKLVIDGQVGSKTFACINACDPHALLAALRSEQAAVYERIVAKFPDQRANINGWLDRAYRL